MVDNEEFVLLVWYKCELQLDSNQWFLAKSAFLFQRWIRTYDLDPSLATSLEDLLGLMIVYVL